MSDAGQCHWYSARLFDGCDLCLVQLAVTVYIIIHDQSARPTCIVAMPPAGPGSLRQRSSLTPDVPTIVHNLIRDMKALETALHRWSCAYASPEDVSDCYVQFGVEFNAVVYAFEGYDIPTRRVAAIQ